MLGHDGLFARRFPIGCTGLMSLGPNRGLPAPVRPVRHRWGTSQSLVRFLLVVKLLPGLIACVLGRSFEQPMFVRFVVSSVVQHRPRYARRLVGQRHRNNVGMTSLQQLIDPPT